MEEIQPQCLHYKHHNIYINDIYNLDEIIKVSYNLCGRLGLKTLI